MDGQLTGKAVPLALNTADDWLRLIGTRSDTPTWRAIEQQYGISAHKKSLIHGVARFHINAERVYLYVFKCIRGQASALEVMGVQFDAPSGAQKRADSFNLPRGLRWDQTRAEVRAHLVRFGEPATREDSPHFDSWTIEERFLHLHYRPRDNTVKSIGEILSTEAFLRRR